MQSTVVERIRRAGPLRFEEYVDLVLYGDGGFYASGHGAGRRADFLTSPEVGPLFGAVIGRALDDWWRELGCPDPYVVVEAGAGSGTLAASVLSGEPQCAAALRYVLVERSELLRARISVPVEPPALALGPMAATGDPDEPLVVAERTGPISTALADLPAAPIAHVVLANELLDNLAFGLLERGSDGWQEVRVGMGESGLVEVLVPWPGEMTVDAPRGARVPLQDAAGAWVRRALSSLERGRLVILDYADTTAGLAVRPWRDWVRTYRAHGRGGDPLEDPGLQDITCEVAIDQLPRPATVTSQAEFLQAHGLEDLVDAAAKAWHQRAAVGDLEALKARSRVFEGDALRDSRGLGGFTVLEWIVR